MADLSIHDLNVRDDPGLGSLGPKGPSKILSFSIGTHGPFYKTFAPGEGTAAAMKQYITEQQSALADLHLLGE